MNRLFKYILLLIIAACGLACSEEVDLTTYKALEIEYVTSNRQAISNLRQWHGEDSYSIIADTYQENSNRGSLFVYPDVSTFGIWFQGCENLTEVYIPGGIRSIGVRAFEKCANLKSVTIPDSVTTIGESAFRSCSSLTSVTIPDGVTTIGYAAFAYCNSLTSVTIPDSVTTIGSGAFYRCSSLTSVYCAATTPPSLGGDSVFGDNASDRKIYVPTMSVYAYKSAEYWSEYADAIVGYNFETGEVDKDPLDELTNNKIYYTNGRTTTPTQPNNTSVFDANIVSNMYDSSLKCWAITFDADLTMIGDEAFSLCTSLTSVTIPDSVTTIGNWAFYNCTSLTSVTIPDSVTKIGDYAFYECDSLTSVTIPDSVTTIGGGAFSGCDSLTSVTIGDSVTTIGNWAFYNCSSLTSVTIPDSVTTIGDYAFSDCSSLTSVTIGDGVTTIGNLAFFNCHSLASVTIPDSVTTIGNSAFSYCSSLTSVTIPDSVTTIEEEAFGGCSSLTSVTIPDSVTTIGNNAFYNCDSLTSVTIPDSVTTIGNGAFQNCDSLTSVYCAASTPPVLGGNYVFDGNGSDRKIYVPTVSVDTYKSAEHWSNYADAIVGYNFETGEDVMPDEMRNRVIYYTATTQVEAHSAYPWTYDTFGANIVSHEWNSETGEGIITFDGDVTTIGDYAFYYCDSLISVTIPDSVTTIGQEAFCDCDSLTSITIPDSITMIGYGAFYDCSSLTSVTIPDSVKTIGGCAFGACSSLISITIPNSVTMIGEAAFLNCSSLTSVYCAATTPPVLGNYVFVANGSGRKIYVPTVSVDTYKSAEYWCSYADAIVGYNFETGEEVMPDEMRNRVIYYTATRKVEAHSAYPWTYDTFGANIVSHEWNSESGEGVITFDADVTTIGYSAFYDCDSLTSVTIPDSVTTIGGWAFSSCDSLAEFKGKFAEDNGRILVVDGTLVAFAPSGLTEYAIPDSVTTIGDAAFSNCSSLTSVTIPDSVTTIGEWAFAYCSNLTSVTIGDSVTTIGYAAFAFCSNLTSITIPDSVTTIGGYAFDVCSSLTSVTIPDSVTTIGGGAFAECYSLTSITIPDSVTTIGQEAFRDCYSLASVYCEATTPPSLGGNAIFDNNASGRTIYVPSQSVESYKSAEYWSEYADAIVGYDFNTTITPDGGIDDAEEDDEVIL